MLNAAVTTTLAFFVLGNLTSLARFSGLNIYFYDIFLVITNLYFGFLVFRGKKFEINSSFLLFSLFIVFSFVTTIFKIYPYEFSDFLLVLAYFFRFVNYGMFGFLIYNPIKSKILQIESVQYSLDFNFFLLLILNLIQYFWFRDISDLAVFGFDPHQTRLTGTFLDPNFMGIFLILYFIYSEFSNKSKYISYFSFGMILLTESRSAILTLTLVLILLLFRNLKYVIYLFLIIGFTFLTPFLARVELTKASNDSSSLRIESWKNGLTLWQFSSEFGVGFNNYRNMAKFNNLIPPEQYYSNSVNSSDSSLISVLAMTGVIGLIIFILFLASFYNSTNIYFLSAILVNSIFINSLFFPPICVFLILWLNLNKLKSL